jgi:biopolymer transport protein ExbD
MAKFDLISEYQKTKPTIQLAPLVDIAFWALIFFMAIAALNQMESELNITLPKSNAATDSPMSSGKIVINILRDGRFVLNHQDLDGPGLEKTLKKVSALFPNQQVIIKADEMAYHKYVVQALDACLRSNITDVSFSAVKEENL